MSWVTNKYNAGSKFAKRVCCEFAMNMIESTLEISEFWGLELMLLIEKCHCHIRG